jgi:hypothetical protein
VTGATAGRCSSACEADMNAAEQLTGSHGLHVTSVSALCKLSGYPTGSLSPRRFRDLSDPQVCSIGWRDCFPSAWQPEVCPYVRRVRAEPRQRPVIRFR